MRYLIIEVSGDNIDLQEEDFARVVEWAVPNTQLWIQGAWIQGANPCTDTVLRKAAERQIERILAKRREDKVGPS